MQPAAEVPNVDRHTQGQVSTEVVDDARHQTGDAPNELTASEDRDPWAGTPWHESVPARLERVPA